MNSREYAKFKRLFVGPLIPRRVKKLRGIGSSLPMPVPTLPIKGYVYTNEGTRAPADLEVRKARHSAYVIERRKKRDKSMPAWANRDEIEIMYLEARIKTLRTGIKHEVDHIIPSNHPMVCGLHVGNNLQIITEKENILKSNLFLTDILENH